MMTAITSIGGIKMKGKLLPLWLALILSASIISGCGAVPGVVAEAPAVQATVKAPDAETTTEAPTVLQGSGDVVAEERPVSDFDRVSLAGIGDVFITQGEETSLTVEASDNLIEYIETEVRNGTLVLDFTDEAKRRYTQHLDPITFTLSMKDVSGLDISGAGDIFVEVLGTEQMELVISGAGDIIVGSLDANTLEVHLHGAGDVVVDALDAEELAVHLNGACDVVLAGRVVEQDVHVNGAGDYDGAELESQTATVAVNGVGDAIVWATESLDVRIPGTGDVEFRGDPQLSYDVSGLGDLTSRDNPSLRFPPSDSPEVSEERRETIYGSGNVIAEERPVSDFNRVSLSGIGNVIVTQGEEESLTVEADDNLMEYIETEVRGEVLVLGFTDAARDKDVEPTETILFHLTVKEIVGLSLGGIGDISASTLDTDRLEINLGGVGDVSIGSFAAAVTSLEIDLGGAGDVVIDSLVAEEFSIRLGGAGDVDVGSLDAEKSVVHINGAGDVELTGQVVEQAIFLGGAGDYDAGRLESQTAIVEAGGAGTVTVWATDSLDVNIGGPSTVAYYGNPAVIKSISRVGHLVHLGKR
jgi:hypothetical protein